MSIEISLARFIQEFEDWKARTKKMVLKMDLRCLRLAIVMRRLGHSLQMMNRSLSFCIHFWFLHSNEVL